MSRKGTNVYKRKDGRWEGRYVKGYDISGKRVLGFVYGKTYKEALEKKNKAQAECKKFPFSNEDMLFAEAARQWYQKEEIGLKPSSLMKYQRILDSHILPFFGRYKCSQINSELVNQYILKKSIEGNLKTSEGLSSSTIRDIVRIICTIANYVEETTGLHMNIHHIALPKIKKQPRSVFTQEDVKKLVLALSEECDKDLRCVGILLCMYTGLRIGELCALKWSDINLEKETLCITKTMQRIENSTKKCTKKMRKTCVIEGEPKTCSSRRIIPLPSVLVQILKIYKVSYEEDAYLLSGSVKKYVEPRNFQYFFKNFQEKNGIKPLNCHALRHTFATMGVASGIDIKSLSEILGHSNVNITLNYYVHSSMEQKKKQIELLKYS